MVTTRMNTLAGASVAALGAAGLSHDDKLALANAAAANGGLLPEHLRGKAEGLELRAGDVIDNTLVEAAAAAIDPQDVFGRIVDGNLHLFSRKLAAGDKSIIDAIDTDHTALDGYMGTVDGFMSQGTAGLPASGGADGIHPSATVADVIVPTEGLVQTPVDELKAVPRDAATTAEAKAKLAEAEANSTKGASKPKG